MSFQYYTKTLEELQNISRVISTNFAEIIGCEQNSKLWSPPVAYTTCKNLVLAGSNCSNISDQFAESENKLLSYRFTSITNPAMKSIWQKVLSYDILVLNTNKISTVKVNLNLDIENKLKSCIDQSKDYDSTLFSALMDNSYIEYTDDYLRIFWILLSCYTIRYHIYEFSIGASDSIDTQILSDSFLNKIIENIQYEKYSLSTSSFKENGFESSTEYISQQLTLLMKNCKQLKSYVLSYIK